jgi:hypothetical protein
MYCVGVRGCSLLAKHRKHAADVAVYHERSPKPGTPAPTLLHPMRRRVPLEYVWVSSIENVAAVP